MVERDPLLMLMAKFSSHDLTVPKDQVIACATRTSSIRVTPTLVLLIDVLGVDSPIDEGNLGEFVSPQWDASDLSDALGEVRIACNRGSRPTPRAS